jgi:hypothetical protein
MNFRYIPEESFLTRREFFAHEQTGVFSREGVAANNAMAAMMDPNNIKEMVKKNMTFGVSQMLLMNWVSEFFSGFVVGKYWY